jgi:hypothetical protein
MRKGKSMARYRTAPDKCPSCGEKQDALTNTVGEGSPEPGSFAICWKCGEICVIDENGKRAAITKEEFESLPEDSRQELLKIQSDARAGKINPWKDEYNLVETIDEMWADKAVRPLSEGVTNGFECLRKACAALDKAAHDGPRIMPEATREVIELAREALIAVGFEESNEAEYIRQVAAKITEGPGRRWR